MYLSSTCFVVWRYVCGLVAVYAAPRSSAAIAYRKLKGVSFDISEKHRYSYKTLLSGMKQVISYPLKPVKRMGAPTVIYDVAGDTEVQRSAYLRFNGVEDEFRFVSSQSLLYFTSTADRLFFFLLAFPVQLHVLLFGLFRRERSGLASVWKNMLITRNFLAEAVALKQLYMFSIYDTNSAFLSSCAIRKGIHVSQITSEVPLYKWNKQIVTNELILGIDYQRAEAEAFRDTMHYDQLSLFGPEQFYGIAGQYQSLPPKTNTIGFYSTGGWLRNKLGHIDQGSAMETYEARILSDLNDILAKRRDLELVIYPHPREKQFFGSAEQLYAHYKHHLPDVGFTINPKNGPSNTLFDDVYLAVCYMTTLIFERAYAGRRSAIVYFKEQDFPIQKQLSCLDILESRAELETLIKTTYSLCAAS